MRKKLKIGILGLGYVGLPIFLSLKNKFETIGFDIDQNRILGLKKGYDKNNEFNSQQLHTNKKSYYSNDLKDLQECNFYIVTVPTPVNLDKEPNFKPLFSACSILKNVTSNHDIVFFESTVYPGTTKFLKKKFFNKKQLTFGYSPERINPGDKQHTISNIKKITSGSTNQIAVLVDDLYNEIITAGTHKAPSIKVAEAAKVIENTQRDLNIALINELSILFNKMNIDTQAVLDAAGSKWNFLNFKPGLVGGHCIGVDPYYLTYKAERIGYKPNIILAGREINDNMGVYVALMLIKEMKKKNIKVNGSKILIMGMTFKENCADIRNSGVKNVVEELKKNDCYLDLYDPWAKTDEVKELYGITPKSTLSYNTYDAIIVAVAHKKFKDMGNVEITNLCKKDHIIYDLKYLFSKDEFSFRL